MKQRKKSSNHRWHVLIGKLSRNFLLAQEVGNDVTPKWAIYKFSEFTHPISQFDHACSRLGLRSPEEF